MSGPFFGMLATKVINKVAEVVGTVAVEDGKKKIEEKFKSQTHVNPGILSGLGRPGDPPIDTKRLADSINKMRTVQLPNLNNVKKAEK